jgi:hypothetical protein
MQTPTAAVARTFEDTCKRQAENIARARAARNLRDARLVVSVATPGASQRNGAAVPRVVAS